jgi:fumarate hydratase class I
MIELSSPADINKIRKLKTGDRVAISGVIATGRDEVHKHIFKKYDKKAAAVLKDSFIYHCGPIVKKVKADYEIISCGPTTSIREEPYQAGIIKKYGIRGVIGKGGMGQDTLAALKECGAVYLHAPGGAAALLSKSIVEVSGVYFLEEFGIPEAMWVIRVKDFPAIVTMDSKGKSLHKKVYDESLKNYKKIVKDI